MGKRKSIRRMVGITLWVLMAIGFLWPQHISMPVEGATSADYNSESFWYYPWGKSVTHKGVDIFAKKGTPVHSATKGIVIYAGKMKYGGNVVFILGPKWRLHYYAHLDKISTSIFALAGHSKQIGLVGNTGNAAGKSPHLHYSIQTIAPYLWRIDSSRQGWRKMFYLNPIDYLEAH